MIAGIGAAWSALETWLFALVDSAWALLALLAATLADGFFPPVPGETLLIMLGVGAQTGGGVPLAAVFAVATIGAWCGDQIAFSLGRAVGTRKVPFLRGARGQRAVEWAARALRRRGAAVVLAARFVPVGRMAVNVTAGAVGFPRRRFMVLSAAASTLWSAYHLAIAVVAGQWLGDSPLLAVVVGIATGTVLGLVVDRVVRSRDGRAGPAGRAGAEHATRRLPAGDAARAGTFPSCRTSRSGPRRPVPYPGPRLTPPARNATSRSRGTLPG
jgi:membrane-associated protein